MISRKNTQNFIPEHKTVELLIAPLNERTFPQVEYKLCIDAA